MPNAPLLPKEKPVLSSGDLGGSQPKSPLETLSLNTERFHQALQPKFISEGCDRPKREGKACWVEG